MSTRLSTIALSRVSRPASSVLRRGFTIVEMLMVIAVLAVLTGIVSTAATSAIRQARTRKADAIRDVLQNGIAAYYSQRGYWPPKSGQLQKWADDGLDSKYKSKGQHVVTLDDNAYDELMTTLVRECVNSSSSPVMDVGNLTAARKSAAARKDDDGNPMCHGDEFRKLLAALKAGKGQGGGSTMNISDMAFGYTHAKTGRFRRFKIKYNADSDSVTVEK